MGFVCQDRQTTPDFLTSITSPAERIIKPGYERLVPRTPKEFYRYWRRSPERQALLEEIDEYLDNCENYDQKQKYLKLIMPKRPSTPTTNHLTLFRCLCKYVIL